MMVCAMPWRADPHALHARTHACMRVAWRGVAWPGWCRRLAFVRNVEIPAWVAEEYWRREEARASKTRAEAAAERARFELERQRAKLTDERAQQRATKRLEQQLADLGLGLGTTRHGTAPHGWVAGWLAGCGSRACLSECVRACVSVRLCG